MMGDTTLLAIDDHLLPFRRNLCYYMSEPSVRKEPVVAPDGAADANSAHFFGTVLHDAPGQATRPPGEGRPKRSSPVRGVFAA